MNAPQTSAQGVATLRSWFEVAPDAMIAVDQEGRIVLANAQAERLFGYAIGGMHGLQLEALVPDPVRHAHATHRRNYTNQPRVRPMGIGYELAGVKRDGRQFPVEIGLSPIPTVEGVITVASVRDISETRRVRQALVRARRDTSVVQVGRLDRKSTRLNSSHPS